MISDRRLLAFVAAVAAAGLLTSASREDPQAAPRAARAEALDAVLARTVRIQVTRRISPPDKPDARGAGDSGDSGAKRGAKDDAKPAAERLPRREQIVGFLLEDPGVVATYGDALIDAETIVVESRSGELRRARGASRDPQSGVGLVFIDPLKVESRFEPDPAPAVVGAVVHLVGDPQHLGLAVTPCAVAATGRGFDVDSGGLAIRRPNLIQLAVTCDDGDRGGPLVGDGGAILGLCLGPYRAKDSGDEDGDVGAPEGGGGSVAFAVPIAEVLNVARLLGEIAIGPPGGDSASKKPPRPWLGVWVMDIHDEVLESQLELEPDQGLLVESVFPDSPAAKARLERFDVITGFDGDVLRGTSHLHDLLSAAKIGQTIQLEIVRRGKRMQVAITLAEPK